jgi:hypothetical protein
MSIKIDDIPIINEDSWLPQGYEKPKTISRYLKFKEEGKYRFRILTKPVTGFEYFTNENKPVRQKEEFEELPMDIKKGERIKEFWAFVVWDCNDKMIKICEINQQTIKEPILALSEDEDYGDPRGYDIEVTRVGRSLEDTKYTLIAKPPVPTSQEILDEFSKTNVNLEKLFTGEDPFAK